MRVPCRVGWGPLLVAGGLVGAACGGSRDAERGAASPPAPTRQPVVDQAASRETEAPTAPEPEPVQAVSAADSEEVAITEEDARAMSGPSSSNADGPKVGSSIGDDPSQPIPTLNRMRAGFRRCLVQALQRNAKQVGGAVRLRLQIGPNGEVTSAKAETSAPIDDKMLRCLEARASAAQFAPPEGGSAELVVPINMKP